MPDNIYTNIEMNNCTILSVRIIFLAVYCCLCVVFGIVGNISERLLNVLII